MRTRISLVFAFSFLAATAFAESLALPGMQGAPQSTPGSLSEIPAVLPDDAASLLGLGLPDAMGRFGAPNHVSAIRGEAAWQDDVVFSYPSGLSLYWAGDRLWQIRFDSGYPGSVYGLFVGDPVDKAVSLLGSPYYSSGEAIVFRLAYKGYPVRLRVVAAADKVSAIYLYRADF